MKEVVGNQRFSWNVLFPNESNFGKMCKNCFEVFGSAGWSMESNTCGNMYSTSYHFLQQLSSQHSCIKLSS